MATKEIIVKTRLILDVKDGVDVEEVLNDMLYVFTPEPSQATVVLEEVFDWKIKKEK